jgi:hypothetical protein
MMHPNSSSDDYVIGFFFVFMFAIAMFFSFVLGRCSVPTMQAYDPTYTHPKCELDVHLNVHGIPSFQCDLIEGDTDNPKR